MQLTRRSFAALAGAGATMGLAACTHDLTIDLTPDEDPERDPQESQPEEQEPAIDLEEFEDLALDMASWSYDEANDCWYQLSLPYCTKPGSAQYESYAIFVPGPYLTGTKHGATYDCTVNEGGAVGSYTAATAPVIMPLNAGRFNAQECPESYSYEGLGRYLSAGLVYVYPGFRGRAGGYESTTQEYFSGGAPWPVADLKAAVRCLRYNAAVLPCDTSRIFVGGFGGGGGYAALLGASGDAEAFAPYLEELGAATHDVQGNDLSDAVFGSASWCPVLSLGAADIAYEWMMGQYASEGTREEGTWTSLLSTDLAEAYGPYVNALDLHGEDGSVLALETIEDGTFASGGYYDHLLGLVGEAASDYLQRTKFPLTVTPESLVEPCFPGDPSLRATATADADSEGASGIAGVRQVQATVFETLESYVSYLNGENRWLTYNSGRGKADVTGLWGFVQACRPATHDVCAYDALDRSSVSNQLFGTDDEPSLHFDAMVAELLAQERERYAEAEGFDDGLVAAWDGDLLELDSLETDVSTRRRMSDPLTYLLASDETPDAHIAPHWRVRTGLAQSETTLVGEVNLMLALAGHEGVADVDGQLVWGAGFALAERSEDPEDAFVAWVASCCPAREAAEAQESDAEENE